MPKNARVLKRPAIFGAAKATKSHKKALSFNQSVSLCKAVIILLLAATYSPISRLVLSPVYGSIPSSIYHRPVLIAAIISGFILNRFRGDPGRNDVNILPLLAFWIPTIQYVLIKQSSWLGNPTGPLVTEIVTYYPLVLLSVSASTTFLRALHLERYYNSKHVPVAFGIIGIAFAFAHNFAETLTSLVLSKYIGSSIFLNCSALQLLIAVVYAVALPSKLLLLAIPSLLFSISSNVHMPWGHTTAVLNSTLQGYGYILQDREASITGYISVFDSHGGFRAMRCDHSLLGGEWTKALTNYKPKVQDPIYAIFVMLEAVRLIQSENGGPRRMDEDSKALVIGLGIGTTPAALINHGIDTTIVEIDPVVYKFARKYFHLPTNHTVIIDDAIAFVERSRLIHDTYDYIVHDVFTGGVEPVELFTLEFMEGLRSLLRDDGAIAINYAGDLSLPSAGLVVRTILAVFPMCRIFREQPESSETTTDFTNMVIFCKMIATTPLRFRRPHKADFLGSKMRESHLLPKYEIDPSLFKTSGKQILKAGGVGVLGAYYNQNAIGHWKLMRTVIPASVWENW